MFSAIRKKVQKNRYGETLAETLVALLIGVLALLMLPMAAVTSARINRQVRDISTVENKENAEIISGSLTINETADNHITIYQDPSGYVFYRYAK